MVGSRVPVAAPLMGKAIPIVVVVPGGDCPRPLGAALVRYWRYRMFSTTWAAFAVISVLAPDPRFTR